MCATLVWVMEAVLEQGTGYAKEFSSIAGFPPSQKQAFLVVVEGFFPFIYFSPQLDGTEWRETSHGVEVKRVRLLVEAGVSVVSSMVTVGR